MNQEVVQIHETYSAYRSSCFRSPSTSRRSSEISRSRNRYRNGKFNANWTPSRSKYIEFYDQRRNSRSLYYFSRRNSRYRSFSRYNSGILYDFRNYNSSYRPPSAPRSRSVSASRRFVNNTQPNSSENHDLLLKTFQSQKENLESTCIPLGNCWIFSA